MIASMDIQKITQLCITAGLAMVAVRNAHVFIGGNHNTINQLKHQLRWCTMGNTALRAYLEGQ